MTHSPQFRIASIACLASAMLLAASCGRQQPGTDAGAQPTAEGPTAAPAEPPESPIAPAGQMTQDEQAGVEEVAASPSLPSGQSDSPLVGQEAPAFELKLLGGGTANLERHRNRDIVMLDFWATWCGPCVRELPLLAEVAAEYRGKGVVFYAVNQGEEPETIREFLDKKNFDIAVPLDTDSAVADSYGVDGIPTLVLIDKHGTVASVHVGYNSQIKEILQRELDTLLKGKNSQAP